MNAAFGIRRILISIKKPRSKQACSGLFYTYLMFLIANAQLLDDSSNTAGTNGSTTFTLRWIHNPITFRCISDTFLSVLFQIFPHI